MEYVIGIVILAALGYLVYSTVANQADALIGEPEVQKPKPKVAKLSKARLTALTKVQLEEKGRELGIEVDRRLVKSKIVNQVYKAQK